MRAFADMHPAAQAVWFSSVAGCVMFSMDPVLAAISLAGALVLFLYRNRTRGWQTHLWFLALFAGFVIVNPLISHNGATVLFIMNGQPVTAESAIYGTVSGSVILAVLYWFRSFSQIMTSDRLLYLCGRLSPKLALVLSMALRYTALFAEQTKRTVQCQKAVGLYKEENYIDKVLSSMRVFSIMLTWALEHGITTADSMSARGYGSGRRTQFAAYRLLVSDVVLLCASVTGVCLIAAASFMGNFSVKYYPTLHLQQLTPMSIAGYAAYGILVLLPTLIEILENLKWKRYLSNI